MNKDHRVDVSNFQMDSDNMKLGKDEIASLRLNVNPFNTFFKKKLSVVEQIVADDNIENEAKDNRSYCPTFMDFVKSYLPEMAL